MLRKKRESPKSIHSEQRSISKSKVASDVESSGEGSSIKSDSLESSPERLQTGLTLI